MDLTAVLLSQPSLGGMARISDMPLPEGGLVFARTFGGAQTPAIAQPAQQSAKPVQDGAGQDTHAAASDPVQAVTEIPARQQVTLTGRGPGHSLDSGGLLGQAVGAPPSLAGEVMLAATNIPIRQATPLVLRTEGIVAPTETAEPSDRDEPPEQKGGTIAPPSGQPAISADTLVSGPPDPPIKDASSAETSPRATPAPGADIDTPDPDQPPVAGISWAPINPVPHPDRVHVSPPVLAQSNAVALPHQSDLSDFGPTVPDPSGKDGVQQVSQQMVPPSERPSHQALSPDPDDLPSLPASFVAGTHQLPFGSQPASPEDLVPPATASSTAPVDTRWPSDALSATVSLAREPLANTPQPVQFSAQMPPRPRGFLEPSASPDAHRQQSVPRPTSVADIDRQVPPDAGPLRFGGAAVLATAPAAPRATKAATVSAQVTAPLPPKTPAGGPSTIAKPGAQPLTEIPLPQQAAGPYGARHTAKPPLLAAVSQTAPAGPLSVADPPARESQHAAPRPEWPQSDAPRPQGKGAPQTPPHQAPDQPLAPDLAPRSAPLKAAPSVAVVPRSEGGEPVAPQSLQTPPAPEARGRTRHTSPIAPAETAAPNRVRPQPSPPVLPDQPTAAAITTPAVQGDLAPEGPPLPDGALPPLFESDPADLRSAEPRTPFPATSAQVRSDPVLHQVAQRLASLPALPERDAPLELTLDPPELGTIRVSVTRGAEGMVLHLQADLPETLDLLRRHGGALTQELQRQGLDHTGFSFSGQQDDRRQTSATPPAPHLPDDPAESVQARPAPPPPAAARTETGLDLRL